MRYHNWQWRQQVKAGKASPLIRSTYQGQDGDHWWCPPWTIHLVHTVRNSWTDSPLEEHKISVEPFWRGLPSDALPLSLDYLMADRGIHAGTRRERQREQWLVSLKRQLSHSHILSSPHDLWPQMVLPLHNTWKANWLFKTRKKIKVFVLRKNFCKLASAVSPFFMPCLLRLVLSWADIGQFVIVALPSIFSTLEMLCNFRYTLYF